jgi:hypothetical protein
MKFGLINIGRYGMNEDSQCEELREMMDSQGIGVLAVVEHHRGKDMRLRRELGQLVSEDERSKVRNTLGEGVTWYEKCRAGGKGAGVGIAVREGTGEVVELTEFGDEGLLWLKISREEDLYIACVYLVPRTSDWASDNVARQARLARGIENYTKKGRVVVMGDVNGRIGRSSVTVVNEEGDSVGQINRDSDDRVTNEQGRTMLALLEGTGMIVMNGVRGEATEITCKSKKEDGKGGSVADWIVVHKEWAHEWGNMEVDDRGWMDSDHNLVTGVWECSWLHRVGRKEADDECSVSEDR